MKFSRIHSQDEVLNRVQQQLERVLNPLATSVDALGSVSRKVSGWVTPAVATQAALERALASGSPIVDGAGETYTVTSPITIPPGVWLRNIHLVAGTPGMNVVLVSQGSKFTGKITGTGTTSIIERAIYPATDGASDVELDVEIENITVGVHAQPLAATTPKRWHGRVYCHDIVGTTGASEGYGVLLSPAESCQLKVVAKDVKRHALYLSAGARYNDIGIDVDGCGNAAIQFYSSAAQPLTRQNTVRAKVRGVHVPAGQGPNQSVGAYFLAGANQNTLHLDMDGEGTAEGAVTLEGSGGAGEPLPTGNKIVLCNLTGEFIGPNVIREVNGIGNLIAQNTIHGFPTAAVISLGKTGAPTIPAGSSGSRVVDNAIDAQGAAVYGIYTEVDAVTTYVGPNDVRNLTGDRVLLGAGALRTGHCREFSGQVVIACLANAANTAAVTFPDELANARVTANSISMSVTGIGQFPTHFGALTATGVEVTVHNGCGDAQDITVNWVAQGD